jgi:hypothetical protein
MFVVLLGDPINGFVVVGPFTARDDAVAYIDEDPSDETAWVVDLTPPGDARE